MYQSFYKFYMNQSKAAGITISEKEAKAKVYALYTEAFKKGVYDFMAKEKDLGTGKAINRHYFSGGNISCSSSLVNKAMTVLGVDAFVRILTSSSRRLFRVRERLVPESLPLQAQATDITAQPVVAPAVVSDIDALKSPNARKRRDAAERVFAKGEISEPAREAYRSIAMGADYIKNLSGDELSAVLAALDDEDPAIAHAAAERFAHVLRHDLRNVPPDVAAIAAVHPRVVEEMHTTDDGQVLPRVPVDDAMIRNVSEAISDALPLIADRVVSAFPHTDRAKLLQVLQGEFDLTNDMGIAPYLKEKMLHFSVDAAPGDISNIAGRSDLERAGALLNYLYLVVNEFSFDQVFASGEGEDALEVMRIALLDVALGAGVAKVYEAALQGSLYAEYRVRRAVGVGAETVAIEIGNGSDARAVKIPGAWKFHGYHDYVTAVSSLRESVAKDSSVNADHLQTVVLPGWPGLVVQAFRAADARDVKTAFDESLRGGIRMLDAMVDMLMRHAAIGLYAVDDQWSNIIFVERDGKIVFRIEDFFLFTTQDHLRKAAAHLMTDSIERKAKELAGDDPAFDAAAADVLAKCAWLRTMTDDALARKAAAKAGKRSGSALVSVDTQKAHDALGGIAYDEISVRTLAMAGDFALPPFDPARFAGFSFSIARIDRVNAADLVAAA
jgi:hypothetical protein